MVALSSSATDLGKKLRVYGYDQFDQRVRTLELGEWIDGDVVTITGVSGGINVVPEGKAPFFKRIERVEKDETNGFVTLTAFRPRDVEAGLERDFEPIGYYYPDETEPRYKRIRLPMQAAWVRLRYRKRTLKITSMHDPLHLRSKTAITQMMHSIAALDQKDYKIAVAAGQMSVQLLVSEQRSTNPTDTFHIQVDTSVHRPRRAIR